MFSGGWLLGSVADPFLSVRPIKVSSVEVSCNKIRPLKVGTTEVGLIGELKLTQITFLVTVFSGPCRLG